MPMTLQINNHVDMCKFFQYFTNDIKSLSNKINDVATDFIMLITFCRCTKSG